MNTFKIARALGIIILLGALGPWPVALYAGDAASAEALAALPDCDCSTYNGMFPLSSKYFRIFKREDGTLANSIAKCLATGDGANVSYLRSYLHLRAVDRKRIQQVIRSGKAVSSNMNAESNCRVVPDPLNPSQFLVGRMTLVPDRTPQSNAHSLSYQRLRALDAKDRKLPPDPK